MQMGRKAPVEEKQENAEVQTNQLFYKEGGYYSSCNLLG